MSEPEKPPPTSDEKPYDPPVVTPQKTTLWFDSVWVGLIVGFVSVGLGVGAVENFSEGFNTFLCFALAFLLFLSRSFFVRRLRLVLGVFLALGTSAVLFVGGCFLYFITQDNAFR